MRTREPFTIKPGPNNPVGLVWIALSEMGYGIHGTPEPSKISKSESHGCIRMTNWNALQLASMVRKGTQVDFIGSEEARDAKAQHKRPGKEAMDARSLAAMFNPQLYPGTERQIEMSQEELGNIVGASRQRIGRALQDLEKAGLIKVDCRMITVLDIDGLRRFGA